jgi:glycerol-3-phosphate dehydrogenase
MEGNPEFDVLIIGAGIIGCFIARELSLFDLRIGVIEKASYVCNGQTKANGGIIHGGHDPKPGSLKATLNIEGNRAFPALCKSLGVMYNPTGIYVIAFDGGEVKTLEGLLDRGLKNGVEGLSIVDSKEVRVSEPSISEAAVAALSIPSGGIVDVVRLTIALADHAAVNGAKFIFDTEVTGLVRKGTRVAGVESNRGRFSCEYLVNCAGVHADSIMEMAGMDGFKILPRKGEYYILDKALGGIVSRPCFQVPNPQGKGFVVFPTTQGNAIIGGDSVPVGDREDTSTTEQGFLLVQKSVQRLVPKVIDGDSIITGFSGIRATSSTGDFVIDEPCAAEGLLNVAGIASPGLSASPAIAALAVSKLEGMGLALKTGAKKTREYRLAPLFRDCGGEERGELLKRDPGHGRIVCRCEGITEGDIAGAVRAPLPALTLDAVKFRTCAGTGRCQGAFDLARILRILAREGGPLPLDLKKNDAGSRVILGRTRR